MGQPSLKEMVRICNEEQQKRFERAGKEWPGRMCEVEVARILGDEEYLKQPWTTGPCSVHKIVDHIDNDRTNNPADGSNWQHLCRAHNVLKNPPRKRPGAGSKFREGRGLEHSPESVRARRMMRKRGRAYTFGGEDPVVSTMEMAKSLEGYPAYERAAKRIVRRHAMDNGGKGVVWEELNAAASREADVRTPTGNRYLQEMTARYSSSAPFVVLREGGVRYVRFKPAKPEVERESSLGEQETSTPGEER